MQTLSVKLYHMNKLCYDYLIMTMDSIRMSMLILVVIFSTIQSLYTFSQALHSMWLFHTIKLTDWTHNCQETLYFNKRFNPLSHVFWSTLWCNFGDCTQMVTSYECPFPLLEFNMCNDSFSRLLLQYVALCLITLTVLTARGWWQCFSFDVFPQSIPINWK